MRKRIYLGTEIEEKWWKRYRKDKLFARGNGEYWLSDEGFYFRRYLTKDLIFIPFSIITGVKLGNNHSGRLVKGNIVVKILWQKEGITLSSGFIVSKNEVEASHMQIELESKIGS